MKKALVCAAVLAGMALSMTAGVASAIDVNDVTTQSAAFGAETQGARYMYTDDGITPSPYVNNFSSPYCTAKGQHWKLWVQNFSKSEAFVEIINVGTGKKLAGFYVGAGKPGQLYSYDIGVKAPMVVGEEYQIYMTCAGGDLTGSKIYLKCGDTPDEVNDVNNTASQPAALGAQEQAQTDASYIVSESYLVPKSVKTYFVSSANDAVGSYWKLWVYNNSSEPATVSIVEEATGKVVYTNRIASKGTMPFRYNDPDASFLMTKGAQYYVRMTSSGDITGSGLALKASESPYNVLDRVLS